MKPCYNSLFFYLVTVGSVSACLDVLAFGLLYKHRQGQLLVLIHGKQQQQAAVNRPEQHYHVTFSL